MGKGGWREWRLPVNTIVLEVLVGVASSERMMNIAGRHRGRMAAAAIECLVG